MSPAALLKLFKADQGVLENKKAQQCSTSSVTYTKYKSTDQYLGGSFKETMVDRTGSANYQIV